MQKRQISIKTFADIINKNKTILSILLLSIFLGTYRMSECLLWMDEWFSISVAQQPIHVIWSLAPHPQGFYFNSAPPLYETILSFIWDISRQSIVFARLFSVFCYSGTIYLLYLLGKYLKGKQAGLIAAFLGCLNCGYIIYAKSIRSYSLLNMLIIASTYLFCRILKNEYRIRTLVFFCLVNVFILYVSYFGALVLLAEILASICWLKKRQLKQIVLCFLISITPFFYWTKHVLTDIAREPALKANTYTAYDCLGVLFYRLYHGIFQNKFILVVYTFLFLGGFFMFILWKLKKKSEYDLLLMLGIVLVVPMILINILTMNVSQDFTRARYLLCFLFPVFIYSAWIICKLPKRIGITILIMLIFASSISVYEYLNSDHAEFWLARLPQLITKAREFPINKDQTVLIEIEDALFVPLVGKYFYGISLDKTALNKISPRKIKKMAARIVPNYIPFYSVAGIPKYHRMESIDNIDQGDWLFLIYSDWFDKEWGQPFRQKYEQRIFNKGILKNLKLVQKIEISGFVLEVYKITQN
jgi:uncharacterized membrane protein